MGEVFLDRYEVEHEVGQGGMAVVYRGNDRVLHRPVAIKVLHRHLSQRSEARARFAREARVIAKLRHPNVVEVYDYAGEESDRAFLVAEFVEGVSLDAHVSQDDPMPPEVAALVTACVAGALHHAHEKGVIHRDVKPENIMVRTDGVLKLMDFGIAHVVDMEHLTMTGAIIGSPAHMSPEQVDGKALDARTDIFSLGTLFYLLASGRYPFVADTPSGLLKSIVEARVPDIRTVCAGFPDDLYRVLARMMARDPSDRYASAAEVARDLEAAVAAVGLGAASEELPVWFADIPGRRLVIRGRIAAARLDRARDLLQKRRHAIAIRELDVVLSIDPSNEEAQRLLSRARRAVRRRRWSRNSLLFAAGIAGVAVAAAIAIRWIPDGAGNDSGDVSEGSELLVVPGVQIPVREPENASRVSRRDGLLPSAFPNRGGKSLRPVPVVLPAAPTGVPVTIVASPPAVRISIDGRVAGFGSLTDIRLSPGRHRIGLSHPSCDVCRDVEYPFVIDPAKPPKNPLRLSIGYRDATLTVSAQAGGTVLVDGIVRGRTNEALSVPMSGPSAARFQVTVKWPNQPAWSGRALLEPGKKTILAP